MNKETAKASATSAGVAALRAAHLLVDGQPKVLEDTIALKLVDPKVIEDIRINPEPYKKTGSVKLRAHVLLRSRYAEDCLKKAFDKGIRQYLILGSGFDTSAYRQPAWAASLKIFEVDHPATQAQKVERLHQAGIEVPANLSFVPIDFESTSLAEGLHKSSFDFTQPVFISWLGVTYYLTTEAIDAVFAFVASLPKPSEIVFSFAQIKKPGETLPMAAKAAKMGEPWLSYFMLEDLEQKLKSHGFSNIYFLTPEEATRTYFTGRTDGLELANRVSVARAQV